MQFVSFAFILVLLVVAGVNHVVPRKYRYIWLLVVSMAFYVSLDAKYTVVLILSILSTYGAGIVIEKSKNLYQNAKERKDKLKNEGVNGSFLANVMFISCIVLNAGLIFGFKLAGFLAPNSILAPIGISFYGLKAISYLVDVKRGTIKAEKNLIAYALYVSFFTQIVSGPIE